MDEMKRSLPYDPNRLLDAAARWLGARSDRVLSRMLQISLRLLRAIRERRVALPASLLLSIAERLGTGVDELRRLLGDRRKKARMACELKQPGRGRLE